MKWTKNKHRQHPRISVVVSKKVYKGAVGRNRIRRRIYEYVRTHLQDLNSVYDIVIIVTSPEVRTLPSSELTETLDQLFSKAELYKTTNN